jgi:hypothetical protein
MGVANYALSKIILQNQNYSISKDSNHSKKQQQKKTFIFPKIDIFASLRNWLNNIEINDPRLAHRLCRLIPSQCPFARKIELFGKTILNIPPLCKLNPLYEELMYLRFRAISYLADQCGEDVSIYCE